MSAVRPNTPRPIDLAIERADKLEVAANAFLKIEITTAEMAAKAVDHDIQLLRAIQEADETREAERKPHLSAAAEIQELWVPVIARLRTCRDLIKTKIRVWNQAEQRRIDTEKAEAARKVEEARRKAEEATKRAETPKSVSDVIRAQRLADEVAEAQRAADAIPDRPQTRGALSGRASSLRTHFMVEIIDQTELYLHFAEHEAVRGCLQKLAEATVRGMAGDERTLPGCAVTKVLR